MAPQPSGTVTFLFTDIEGSTRLWEAHPAAMQAALIRHDTLLRDAIACQGGYVFKTVGDAFHAAFVQAADALAGALAAQRALAAEPWDAALGPIRVRMGLHTGPAEARAGDYFGPTLNRVARLLAIGHGGQILLSQASQELVRDRLPAGIALRDLGEWRLKDLIRPEHLYLAVTADLPAGPEEQPRLTQLLDTLDLLVAQARAYERTLPADNYPARVAVATLGELARQAVTEARVLGDSSRPAPAIAPPFSPRELAVLALTAEGQTNKAIARSLSISERTVQFHLNSIFGKTGTASRTEAVIDALRRGWLVLPPPRG